MLLATRELVEPATAVEAESAWFAAVDGGQVLGYRDYPKFQMIVETLRGRAAPNGQKLLIVGCCLGYTVRHALAAGYDAFGCDASTWAIARAKELNPDIAARFVVGNATSSTSITSVRRAAGLQWNQRFALLVTEELLTCLTDTEIASALTVLRNACTANLVHRVTPLDSLARPVLEDGVTVGEYDAAPEFTWKTAAEWKALLSPPDVVVDQTMAVI